jgi:3-hydroxyisobutyrate dehydrogenase-like beta-hydroxyacid dehydrogenase
MPKRTVALLHPGEMGAALGACLVGRGLRVVWVPQGRSPATRARADAAGLEPCETLDRALAAAEVVLSVCPPHGALDLARAVAAKKHFRGIFVDANAIAPASAREIARVIEAAGASFVDGGIIGPPPAAPGRTRLYLCGGAREKIGALFASTHVQAIALDGNVGAASALKMAYAAWTKGSTALIAAIRALAQSEGVDASLIEEWKLSQPQLLRESDAVPGKVRKAWRWVAEMEEIAASFEAAGLPGGFHHASAEIYGRLAAFKDSAAPPPLDEITAALRAEFDSAEPAARFPSPAAGEGGAERSEVPGEGSRADRRLKLRRG